MLKEIFESAGADIVKRLKESHLRAGQKATGKTLSEFKFVATENGVTVYGANHIEYLDRGRGSGGIPVGFAHIIYNWSLAKGIAFENDQARKTFSYFVSKKIAEQGTYQHIFGRTYRGFEKPISSVFTEKKYLEKLTGDLAKKIATNEQLNIRKEFEKFKYVKK